MHWRKRPAGRGRRRGPWRRPCVQVRMACPSGTKRLGTQVTSFWEVNLLHETRATCLLLVTEGRTPTPTAVHASRDRQPPLFPFRSHCSILNTLSRIVAHREELCLEGIRLCIERSIIVSVDTLFREIYHVQPVRLLRFGRPLILSANVAPASTSFLTSDCGTNSGIAILGGE